MVSAEVVVESEMTSSRRKSHVTREAEEREKNRRYDQADTRGPFKITSSAQQDRNHPLAA